MIEISKNKRTVSLDLSSIDPDDFARFQDFLAKPWVKVGPWLQAELKAEWHNTLLGTLIALGVLRFCAVEAGLSTASQKQFSALERDFLEQLELYKPGIGGICSIQSWMYSGSYLQLSPRLLKDYLDNSVRDKVQFKSHIANLSWHQLALYPACWFLKENDAAY